MYRENEARKRLHVCNAPGRLDSSERQAHCDEEVLVKSRMSTSNPVGKGIHVAVPSMDPDCHQIAFILQR